MMTLLVAGCAADIGETFDDEESGADEVDSATSAVTASSSSGVNECQFKYADGKVLDGYPKAPGVAVWNVTTRNVTCTTANAMAKSFYRALFTAPGRSKVFDNRGFDCKETPQGEGADVRCTKGTRVVRFQWGA